MKSWIKYAAIISGLLVIVVGLFIYFTSKSDLSSPSTSQSNSAQQPTSNESEEENVLPEPKKNTKTTEEQLLYLIEEEKLAHDVYTKMFEKYGAQVFGNILESESTHQSRVLALLVARGIDDPRSQEVGVFVNAELQTLYDALIEKGNISAKDAYEVGVMIEEKDINDISLQLSTATDQDVIDALEALRRGSENHLRAFNRQL